jgi:ceramide glucosyltransferase
VPYFFSIIANLTLWPVAWVTASMASQPALVGIAICLLVRMTTAAAHWRRLVGQPLPFTRWLLVPVKDLVQVIFWGAAFLTATIEWRGTRYRIRRDGTLAELDTTPAAAEPASRPV